MVVSKRTIAFRLSGFKLVKSISAAVCTIKESLYKPNAYKLALVTKSLLCSVGYFEATFAVPFSFTIKDGSLVLASKI